MTQRRVTRKACVFVLVFLAGGAIVNVAVAWGCALWSPERYSEVSEGQPPQPLWWTRSPQSFEKDIEVPTVTIQGFGTRGIAMGADLWGCFIREPGWPCATFQYGVEILEGSKDSPWCHRAWRVPSSMPWVEIHRRFIPNHVLVVGFAINTIFYAAMLVILFYGPGKVRRFVRVRRGRCPACGFIIAPGTCASGLCSECGATLPARLLRPATPAPMEGTRA